MFASGELCSGAEHLGAELASETQALHDKGSANEPLANTNSLKQKNDLPKKIVFSWATWIRTKNDRTRICSVTITP